MDLGPQTPPYALALPAGLPIGDYDIVVGADYSPHGQYDESAQSSYLVSIDQHQPARLAVTSKPSYFPYRDGFEDAFATTVTPTASGTATLTIFRGHSMAARAVKVMGAGVPTTVTTGARLTPGSYNWSLRYVTYSGQVTQTAAKHLTADSRTVKSHPGSVHVTAAAALTHLGSVPCATASTSGAAVRLTVTCTPNDPSGGFAGADFSIAPQRSLGLGSTITVTLHATGVPVTLFVSDVPSSGTYAATVNTTKGVAVATVSTAVLRSGKLVVEVGTRTPGSAQVSSFDLHYTYLTPVAAPGKHR